jgi:hypothetical protein
MTIHPVRMNGVVLGVPQTLSYFDKMQDRIVHFVEDNSGITGKQFRRLMMKTGELVMDVGTVLDGQEAVDVGLIDHLGGLSDAINCLYEMIEAELPEQEDEEEEGAENTAKAEKSEKPVRKKKAPAPASPRAIAQLKQNELRKLPARKSEKKPRRAVARARQNDAHNAVSQTHRLEREAFGDNDPGMADWNGGDRWDVNPFGHPARDAD